MYAGNPAGDKESKKIEKLSKLSLNEQVLSQIGTPVFEEEPGTQNKAQVLFEISDDGIVEVLEVVSSRQEIAEYVQNKLNGLQIYDNKNPDERAASYRMNIVFSMQ